MDKTPIDSNVSRLFAADSRLSEIVRCLVQTVEPVRIYLFGSRARGDAKPDSDYDLVLIYDGPLSKRELKIKTRRELPADLSFDLLVLTSREMDRYRNVTTSLPWEIEREGVAIYG